MVAIAVAIPVSVGRRLGRGAAAVRLGPLRVPVAVADVLAADPVARQARAADPGRSVLAAARRPPRPRRGSPPLPCAARSRGSRSPRRRACRRRGRVRRRGSRGISLPSARRPRSAPSRPCDGCGRARRRSGRRSRPMMPPIHIHSTSGLMITLKVAALPSWMYRRAICSAAFSCSASISPAHSRLDRGVRLRRRASRRSRSLHCGGVPGPASTHFWKPLSARAIWSCTGVTLGATVTQMSRTGPVFRPTSVVASPLK